jgi:transposase-like protein
MSDLDQSWRAQPCALIPVQVNVIEVACNRCRLVRSRRGGFALTLADGRKHFLCKQCLSDLERQVDLDFLRAAGLRGPAA